ncbi:hypothetical protein PAAG_11906 [Paracoccidioides lutzii Pb01]|uniref:Uncharacterized protein n=1 Tax=Paracoccidioides lutzii (strain ATCC MYA-826 / Pb01) TaxID=502779 RepID=A0A0A2VKL7_PARBA|nr:hypothetical protein PAAG_11906 [Paracoccidioides lutzii Pb01]KGQ01439.1 hypothetical protein PAAG_11906 [Paracoccidioides lutzii Pb01]
MRGSGKFDKNFVAAKSVAVKVLLLENKLPASALEFLAQLLFLLTCSLPSPQGAPKARLCLFNGIVEISRVA